MCQRCSGGVQIQNSKFPLARFSFFRRHHRRLSCVKSFTSPHHGFQRQHSHHGCHGHSRRKDSHLRCGALFSLLFIFRELPVFYSESKLLPPTIRAHGLRTVKLRTTLRTAWPRLTRRNTRRGITLRHRLTFTPSLPRSLSRCLFQVHSLH